MAEINNIVLVDPLDIQTGIGEKIIVHKRGLLHRAFSILIFNENGELLIQKREKNKYHSGGLWANTCCSHQREGESLFEAIHRRLIEEFGFDTELKELYKFHYFVSFDNGLIENEIDHVFMGQYEGIIKPNKEEIEEYKWISLKDLGRDVKLNEKNYAYWFKLILQCLRDKTPEPSI